MKRTEDDFMHWLWTEASPQEKELVQKVYDFADLFADMLFRPGSSSYSLTQAMVTDPEGNGLHTVGMSIPEELDLFDYCSYYFKVEEPSDCGGYYNHAERTLCISPELLSDDATILHEMIHLHEAVVNDLPMYFHDMLYWSLYTDLKVKIPDLDEIITQHAHILTGSTLYAAGGLHDILFLLKSFSLDISQGYPLGTVFSYGREETFRSYSYKRP